MKQIPKAFFLSHGGGPMPLLGDSSHKEMVTCLQEIASRFPKPEAIVMVSAHWEEKVPTITAAQHPSLIYDYGGFPEEAYSIEYPCPGNPVLAKEVYQLLRDSDIEAKLDNERGFDHGLFVPLKIMYPEADIPCIQLSLVNRLDPAEHLKIGVALQSLHKKNVLVIGSGFSFHNMRAFFATSKGESQDLNQAFEKWLLETCGSNALSEEQRTQRLIHWLEAPGARFCHPREEHLLPLHVCYGVAHSHAKECIELNILGKKASMYLW